MERAPTVSEMIDQRPMGRYQIWTMALCGTVIVLDGFDTQSIGFLAPSMAESLHIPIKNFGPIFVFALIGLMISSMSVRPDRRPLGTEMADRSLHVDLRNCSRCSRPAALRLINCLPADS